MTQPTILLAPAPGITFVAMPSGATYVADENALVKIANGSIADELALIAAGAVSLVPLNLGATQQTLAGLFAQDASTPFAQGTWALVYADATTANDGFWIKTGSATGSSNWTQQTSVTISTLQSQISTNAAAIAAEATTRAAADTAETARAESIETFIQAKTVAVGVIWADEKSPFNIAFTDASGNVLDGSIYLSGVRYTTNPNSLTINALWADETYGLYAVTDPTGALIVGQTTAGVVWPPAQLAMADRAALSFYESTFAVIWDEIYGLAITDGNNNVLFGIRHNGSVDIAGLNSALSGWWPFVDSNGTLGTTGSLWANNGTSVFRIAAPQGTGVIAPPPYLVGQTVTWNDMGASPPELRSYAFNAEVGVVPANITTIVHVPELGESTSVGTDAGALFTASPISTTNAFMFNGGIRLLGITDYSLPELNVKAPDATQQTLIPLQEVDVNGWGETQQSGCAYSVLNLEPLPSNTAYIGHTSGIAGTVIGQLGRGSQPYKNLLRAIERMNAIAKQNGQTYSVPCIMYVQGINDSATSEATWNAALVALQSNLTSDINAITGGSAQVPLFIVQYACWTSVHQSNQAQAPAECQGMIDAYNANSGKIFLVGNSYHLPWFASDGVHMVAQGYRMQGEEIGRAIAEYLAGGTGNVTPPLLATAATASHGASSLTVTFNNATQLALDTSIVSDPGQSGLRLTDSGGSPIALSSIAVTGTNQITATTTTALTIGGIYNLGIANFGTAGSNAGPTAGPRSTIRDSAPESYSMGGRMYRYACTQSIPVTVGA